MEVVVVDGGNGGVAPFGSSSVPQILVVPQNEVDVLWNKFVNEIALTLYLVGGCFGCVVWMFNSDLDPMWKNWSVMTLILVGLQYLYAHKNKLPRYKYETADVQVLLVVGILFFLGALVATSLTQADNRHRVPVDEIPSLEEKATSWCTTACPYFNNLTNTCKEFNAKMLLLGADRYACLTSCFERAMDICPAPMNTNVVANSCADAWVQYNYALEKNDANTEKPYRNSVNLVYGSLLSLATTTGYTILLFFFFYLWKKCFN